MTIFSELIVDCFLCICIFVLVCMCIVSEKCAFLRSLSLFSLPSLVLFYSSPYLCVSMLLSIIFLVPCFRVYFSFHFHAIYYNSRSFSHFSFSNQLSFYPYLSLFLRLGLFFSFLQKPFTSFIFFAGFNHILLVA